MRVAALCASHTPLKDYYSPELDAQREVDTCFDALRAWVRDFAPELVIVFGPDHFNGFFYQLMPSFCVGAAAEAIGDWNTPTGPLPVDAGAALALVQQLHEAGVDTAISYRMQLDHGLTQTLQMVFDWTALPPVIPIFINCAAAPRPPFARVIALGRAVGEFARTTGRRVLIVGSGGLSHDPPVPTLATATPEVRERIVTGGALSPEARQSRQRRVIAEGEKQATGKSENIPVNPTWDRAFLDMILNHDFDGMASLRDPELTIAAGHGGHEVRTWVASAAALSVFPECRPRLRMYRAIPAWVAGFGVLTIE